MEYFKEKHKKYNALIYIYIFFLYLTTAKGIKIGGSIGIGEIGLLIISLMLIIFNREHKLNKPTVYTLIFWFLLLVNIVIGLFIRENFYNFPTVFPRTLFAYGFSFLISFTVLNSSLFNEKKLVATEAYSNIIGVLSIIFFLIIITGTKSIGGTNFYWLGTNRFQGLSLDPNQFTIPYIIYPFIFLYLYSKQKDKKSSYLTLIIFIITVIVAFASESDTIIVAWFSGVVSMSLMPLIKFIVNKDNYKIKYILIFFTVISVFFLLIISNLENINNIIVELLTKDGQFEKRVSIWKDSSSIIGLSPIFGLGPDVGYIGTSGKIGEAHNNFLQLGMSTGLLGIILLSLYLGYFLVNAFKSKNAFLFACIVALITFGFTHYTLRHPLYWFLFLLVNSLSIHEQSDVYSLK